MYIYIYIYSRVESKRCNSIWYKPGGSGGGKLRGSQYLAGGREWSGKINSTPVSGVNTGGGEEVN